MQNKNNTTLVIGILIAFLVGLYVGQKIGPGKQANDNGQEATVSTSQTITKVSLPKYTEKQLLSFGARSDQNLADGRKQALNQFYQGRSNDYYYYNCFGFDQNGQGISQSWVSATEIGQGGIWSYWAFGGSIQMFCSLDASPL